jgi:SAM-dependent methyltransferase
VKSGWNALLMEPNPSLFVHLSELWRAQPQARCIHVDSSELQFNGAHLNSLGQILARNEVPREFGILILNRPGSGLRILRGFEDCGFRPSVVVANDEAEEAEERATKYCVLAAGGYRYAGVEESYSVWVRADSIDPVAPETHQSVPAPILSGVGKAGFDTPTTAGRFTAAGHIAVLIKGWAFVELGQPPPRLVYIEIMDIRTGFMEYVRASRYSRLDVSRHFGDPDLLIAGFRAIVPMLRSHSSGLKLRVVQCDEHACYRSSTELTLDRGLEEFERDARQGLARKFLRGAGIEIGALQRKLDLPESCRVRYVDRMSIADLMHHYPELESLPLQAPDLVDDGEHLQSILGNSLDFVIANHFFEHCENPIQTLNNFLRVLKPGGIVFLAVPDKRFSFDAHRPSTLYQTLRETYQSGTRSDRIKLYREWVQFVELQTGNAIAERASDLMEARYSIHFNVWSADDLFELLLQARREFCLPFEISAAVCSDNETIVLLERIL